MSKKNNYFIPKPNIKQGLIPSGVAEVSRKDDPEVQLFKISFKNYNDSRCQISLLEKNNARRVLLDFRAIGKCTSLRSLKESNIGVEPITNAGAYKGLFNRLSDDVEMKEHIIQGPSRLFYFIEGNLFNVVSIENSHIPLGKHR